MKPGALLPLVLLGGCVLPSTAAFDACMQALVGKPEVDVTTALGVPPRSTEAGGLRFIQYERRRVVGTPTAGASRFRSPCAGGFIDTRECPLAFTLCDGRVERFDRRGNDCLALPENAG